MSHYKYQNTYSKRFISITSIPEYSNKSFEEMRYEYYLETNPNTMNDFKQPTSQQTFSDEGLLRSNEPIKRGRLSDSFFTNPIKRMKIQEKPDNEISDDDEPVNRCNQLNTSLNEEIDSISSSIGKTIKSTSDKRKPKWKSGRNQESKSGLEEQRIVCLIDRLRKEGNDHVKEGNNEAAHFSYSTAIAYSVRHKHLGSICHANRALSLLRLGRTEEALLDCEKAVALDDRNHKAQLRQIKCLIDLERFEEAREAADSFHRLLPSIEEGRTLLATVTQKALFSRLMLEGDRFSSLGKHAEALHRYNEAITIDGGVPSLYKRRAEVLLALGRPSEALMDCLDCLKLPHAGPVANVVRQSMVHSLVALNRFQEAVDHARLVQGEAGSSQDGKEGPLEKWVRAEEARAGARNYYEVLGVSRTADVAEIRRRYRKLSLACHPDKIVECGGGAEARAAQEDRFKRLSSIYGTLADPVSRRTYDLSLGPFARR